MLLIISAVTWSAGSSAQVAVFDPANFGQSVITATNAVLSVENQVAQIAYQVRMVDNQIKALQRLADGDFVRLNGSLRQQMNQINRVVNTARGVSYRVGRVKEEFEELFPNLDAENLAEVPPAKYNEWHSQLLQASADSVEAQTTVQNIQTSNDDAQRILATSMAADGQVRQLQSVNAMLGVLSGQMGDTAVVVATAARVTALQAAKESAEDAAGRAALEKFMQPARLLNDSND